MPQKLLMQVEKSVSLTGLGLLLLAPHTTPLLAGFALHTYLQVLLKFPDNTAATATASVEEISRPTEATEVATETRALLLAEAGIEAVPVGACVYLLATEVSF